MIKYLKTHVFTIVYIIALVISMIVIYKTTDKYEIRYSVKLVNDEKIYDVSDRQFEDRYRKSDRISVVINGKRYMQEQIEWYSVYTKERKEVIK